MATPAKIIVQLLKCSVLTHGRSTSQPHTTLPIVLVIPMMDNRKAAAASDIPTDSPFSGRKKNGMKYAEEIKQTSKCSSVFPALHLLYEKT